MSVETIILYVAGALLLLITASRFLVQELIALVLLWKKLRATIKAEIPFELSPHSDQTGSRRKLDSGGP